MLFFYSNKSLEILNWIKKFSIISISDFKMKNEFQGKNYKLWQFYRYELNCKIRFLGEEKKTNLFPIKEKEFSFWEVFPKACYGWQSRGQTYQSEMSKKKEPRLVRCEPAKSLIWTEKVLPLLLSTKCIPKNISNSKHELKKVFQSSYHWFRWKTFSFHLNWNFFIPFYGYPLDCCLKPRT